MFCCNNKSVEKRHWKAVFRLQIMKVLCQKAGADQRCHTANDATATAALCYAHAYNRQQIEIQYQVIIMNNKSLDLSIPKTVLITGCSSGIGYCVAKGLQQKGYQVFATARKDTDVARLRQEGLTALLLDLDDPESITACVATVKAQTGERIDVLFNNGAYGQPGAVEDLSRDTLRAQLETNLLGTLELTNQVIPLMRQHGYGRIIQNSSVLGLISLPYRGAYNISKYALEGLTDTLRLELHGTGIAVSLIEPGPIESKFRENAYRAFQKNIDRDHSAHREIYDRLERRLKKTGHAAPFTQPPEAVLKKVIHAIENDRPRVRYYVTFPTYLFGTLKRILSARMLDRLLKRVSDRENQ
jgi:NAD(P)-dependent dehydrogenase (short-subunit alcohol dehydrogenase family)